MTRPLDRTRTLDELDPPAWGSPKHESYLVTTCHRLRTLPLETLGIEDLRILIGQGIGLHWLMPLALEKLEANPLVQGDCYPGDLLKSVLGVPAESWAREWEWRDRLRPVLASVDCLPKEVADAVAAFQQRMA